MYTHPHAYRHAHTNIHSHVCTHIHTHTQLCLSLPDINTSRMWSAQKVFVTWELKLDHIHWLFRYFQISACFAFVDIWIFGWGKHFSVPPSLRGCVNQLFLIISSHQSRTVGKVRSINSVSIKKGIGWNVDSENCRLEGFYKVTTLSPCLIRKETNSPPCCLLTYLPSFSQFPRKARKLGMPANLSEMLHPSSRQTSPGTYNF